jgi:hypothetical protein
MEKEYLLEHFPEGKEHINLGDFYSKLKAIFPSIEAQEISNLDNKYNGITANSHVINFYALGQNQSLTVLYYLNAVFGSYCKNLQDASKDLRIIEKIKIIQKNLNPDSLKNLEKLVANYR